MVRIGRTGIDIFPLNLGGNVFGWTADERTSFGILDAFVEGGGNFVDSADVYSSWVDGNVGGESETILGRWMEARGNRTEVVIATKVGSLERRTGASAANILAAVDESLARLQTDYIDLYYIHRDDPVTPLEETLDALDGLVRSGKVRAIGASNFTTERLRNALAIADANGWARFEALQPPYSLVDRSTLEGPLETMAAGNGLSIFTYSSLGSGFLTGKYRTSEDVPGSPRSGGAAKHLETNGKAILDALDEIAHAHGADVSSVALAWIRQRPSITAPIASASVPEQVAALLASATLELGGDELERLNQASTPV